MHLSLFGCLQLVFGRPLIVMDEEDKDMDNGVGAQGRGDSDVGRRGLVRTSSGAAILNSSGGPERGVAETLNYSRVNALRATVMKHSESVYKLLLSSKETLERRSTIEAVFRACRDAFLEVSAVLIDILEVRSNACVSAEDIKNAVAEALQGSEGDVRAGGAEKEKGESKFPSVVQPSFASYASVAGSSRTEGGVAGGRMGGLPGTTGIMIVPDNEHLDKYATSQATKDVLCKVFKPSDCGLKVNRVSLAGGRGVRIEAYSPDIGRIKAHLGLVKAGLKVEENPKVNPRIIIHGVPTSMTAEDIRNELIAQNLEQGTDKDLKVIYIYPAKKNGRYTSCVLEVAPAIRNILLRSGRVFLRYAACNIADYIRILQCYKCLQFGHIAANCKSGPACSRCSGDHEMRDCTRKNEPPVCRNCKQIRTYDLDHEATDSKKCAIIGRKIRDRMLNINYDSRTTFSDGLRICHVNCQSLLAHWDEFQLYFVRAGYNVICMSETWLRPEITDAMIALPGYTLCMSLTLSCSFSPQ